MKRVKLSENAYFVTVDLVNVQVFKFESEKHFWRLV